MAGERHMQAAVKALHDLLSSATIGLVPALRTVETAQSLAVGSLTDPIAIVRAPVPLDNRSPLVQVYERAWDFSAPAGQRHGFSATECEIAVSFTCGPDIEAGWDFVRRYMIAIVDVIKVAAAAGTSGAVAMIVGDGSPFAFGDSSSTRLTFQQGVQVRVHSPGGG